MGIVLAAPAIALAGQDTIAYPIIHQTGDEPGPRHTLNRVAAQVYNGTDEACINAVEAATGAFAGTTYCTAGQYGNGYYTSHPYGGSLKIGYAYSPLDWDANGIAIQYW